MIKVVGPKGIKYREGFIKIAVAFPEDLFKKIKKRAEKKKMTFSETVSDLSACGLLDLEDLERGDQPLPENHVHQ
jgi:hypothetical protein